SPIIQLRAEVCAFERIRVIVIRAGARCVELVPKYVVIKSAVGPGKRGISVLGSIVSGIGSETQLGNWRIANTAPRLHNASHRVRAIKSALRTAQKFDTVFFEERKSAEIECAARVIDRDSIHDHFVVAGIASAHEQ